MGKDISELERILKQDGAFRGLSSKAKAKALLRFVQDNHPDVYAHMGSELEDNEKKSSGSIDSPISASDEDGLVVAPRNKIYCFWEGKKYLIAERDGQIRALAFHERRLYDGGSYGAIFDTLSGAKVARRDGWVRALVSHMGGLYDSGDYGAIFDTLHDPEGKNPLWKCDNWMTAMASVPFPLWEELARKGTLVKD